MENKIEFIANCKKCNTENEIAIPKDHLKELFPRYCMECGTLITYLKKPDSLKVVCEPQ